MVEGSQSDSAAEQEELSFIRQADGSMVVSSFDYDLLIKRHTSSKLSKLSIITAVLSRMGQVKGGLREDHCSEMQLATFLPARLARALEDRSQGLLCCAALKQSFLLRA